MAVLKIENVSKQYRLGQVGTGTLSHDLKRWWYLARGKEDPFAKVGAENDRSVAGGDYVWALKDINFEVQQGEVLGIIGKNGAGKSTLLKLLSQVTQPTTGNIKVKGRIASLLEVGTGFHPELTGRENIFLNGAILGMTRAEVRRKLDEIVEFAGVAKFLDTPTKRYSSGMTVRLGFAIAAHLEPEILVVDEVLAVGDAEFQKKAIGKMKDVSQGQGRTVLFVSHNMTSIENLCNRCLLVEKGKISYDGSTQQTIDHYLRGVQRISKEIPVDQRADRKGLGEVMFTKVNIVNGLKKTINFIKAGDSLRIIVEVKNKTNIDRGILPSVIIRNEKGERIFTFSALVQKKLIKLSPNQNKEIEFYTNRCFLVPGNYSCDLFLAGEGAGSRDLQDQLEGAFSLVIQDGDFYGTGVTNSKVDKVFAEYQIEEL